MPPDPPTKDSPCMYTCGRFITSASKYTCTRFRSENGIYIYIQWIPRIYSETEKELLVYKHLTSKQREGLLKILHKWSVVCDCVVQGFRGILIRSVY